MTTERRAVTFLRNQTPYMAGETAGFSPDRAERYVNAGVAKYAHRQMRSGEGPAVDTEDADTNERPKRQRARPKVENE